MASLIDQVFGSTGILSSISTYERRPSQEAMARTVHQVFNTNSVGVVEGGCGTGKSFAYLIPAIDHAMSAPGKIAMICVPNIALQNQLVDKDLPTVTKLLKDRLNLDVPFGLIKGRGNYLCRSKLDTIDKCKAAHKPYIPLYISSDFKLVEQFEGMYATALFEISNEDSTGDRDSVGLTVDDRVWREFSASSEECLGSDCPNRKECFYVKKMKEAIKYKVVVTNYHVFLTNLKLLTKEKPPFLLSPSCIVFDEAHNLEQITQDVFGFKLTRKMFSNMHNNLATLGEHSYMQNDKKYNIADLAYVIFDRYKDAKNGEIIKGHIPEATLLGNILTSKLEVLKERSKRDNAISKIYKSVQTVRDCVFELGNPASNRVYFIEMKDGLPVIVSKPVDVSTELGPALFNPNNRSAYKEFIPVVLTSATMAIGNSLAHFKNTLGIGESVDLVVNSPFNFKRQMRIFVAPEEAVMDNPNHEAFDTQSVEIFKQVIDACKGRTLGLFTSWQSMKYIAEALQDYNGYRIMCQGDAPRAELAQAFRDDISSCLLATKSFWEGLDVPGEALSAVVIHKLPFLSNSDPVVAALMDKLGKDEFRLNRLPRAIMQLRQGVGRLIRHTKDKGVIVFIDRRVLTKPYRIEMRMAMPDTEWSTDLNEIAKFMQ